ncbi:MAG: AraC family transcriptional regulator [Armatimonadetes bacterium]|nr:AraC family transcriptional regulator [Armatimonadota bacterium]
MSEESGNVDRSFDAASIEVDADSRTSALQPCLCQTWGHDSARKSGLSIHREGFELGVVLEGRMRTYLGARSRLHLPGDVWLVGMWEPHRWQAATSRTCTLGVLFSPEFITEEVLAGSHWQPMFTCPPQDRPVVSGSEMRHVVLGIARDIAGEAERKQSQWSTVVRLCLAKLFVILGRCWQPKDVKGAADAQTPATFDRIMPALRAIRSRPAERLSLARAAADCGLSTAQFSRVFARTMGTSFGRFRTRAHLSYAASLLLETGLSIDAVAERAGFTDASHLHRLFVKHYEATPGEFRHEFR